MFCHAAAQLFGIFQDPEGICSQLESCQTEAEAYQQNQEPEKFPEEEVNQEEWEPENTHDEEPQVKPGTIFINILIALLNFCKEILEQVRLDTDFQCSD